MSVRGLGSGRRLDRGRARATVRQGLARRIDLTVPDILVFIIMINNKHTVTSSVSTQALSSYNVPLTISVSTPPSSEPVSGCDISPASNRPPWFHLARSAMLDATPAAGIWKRGRSYGTL